MSILPSNGTRQQKKVSGSKNGSGTASISPTQVVADDPSASSVLAESEKNGDDPKDAKPVPIKKQAERANHKDRKSGYKGSNQVLFLSGFESYYAQKGFEKRIDKLPAQEINPKDFLTHLYTEFNKNHGLHIFLILKKYQYQKIVNGVCIIKKAQKKR